jgi:hypothetical protein
MSESGITRVVRLIFQGVSRLRSCLQSTLAEPALWQLCCYSLRQRMCQRWLRIRKQALGFLTFYLYGLAATLLARALSNHTVGFHCFFGCHSGFEWCSDSCPARRRGCCTAQEQQAALTFVCPAYQPVQTVCICCCVCGRSKHQSFVSAPRGTTGVCNTCGIALCYGSLCCSMASSDLAET